MFLDLDRHIIHQFSNAAQNFMVRRHLAAVEEFSVRERWDTLNPQDLKMIGTTLSQLPTGLPNENPLIKRFDLICLKIFIRTLVGLDRAAAKEAFSKYLETQQFNANQIRFVEQVIDLLTQQGVMNPHLLYEPPFTDFH
jgi:type I site-specific restriction endonuclease